MEEKRKRGGQPGNKNAVGGRGNPHPNPPPVHFKHGAYRKPRPMEYKPVPVEDWKEFLPILREYERENGSHRKAKYRQCVLVPVDDWAVIEWILDEYENREE